MSQEKVIEVGLFKSDIEMLLRAEKALKETCSGPSERHAMETLLKYLRESI